MYVIANSGSLRQNINSTAYGTHSFRSYYRTVYTCGGSVFDSCSLAVKLDSLALYSSSLAYDAAYCGNVTMSRVLVVGLLTLFPIPAY